MTRPATMLQRRRRVERHGSPTKRWNMPATAPGARQVYEIDTATELATSRRFAPLDCVEIVNSDAVDLLLTIDQIATYFIPAGSTRTVERRSWRSIWIENLDGATTSTLGAISIMVWRAPVDADEMARRRL